MSGANAFLLHSSSLLSLNTFLPSFFFFFLAFFIMEHFSAWSLSSCCQGKQKHTYILAQTVKPVQVQVRTPRPLWPKADTSRLANHTAMQSETLHRTPIVHLSEADWQLGVHSYLTPHAKIHTHRSTMWFTSCSSHSFLNHYPQNNELKKHTIKTASLIMRSEGYLAALYD